MRSTAVGRQQKTSTALEIVEKGGYDLSGVQFSHFMRATHTKACDEKCKEEENCTTDINCKQHEPYSSHKSLVHKTLPQNSRVLLFFGFA
jgi:hypothetical protein